MSSLRIDVYSDIACPWCLIGTRRLASVIESYGGSIEFEVRHHPYLLHPHAPREGLDLVEMLAGRYGGDPAPMFARVEAAARAAGIELDMSRQRRAYSTVHAHTLLRHAEARGTQGALADALFTAYFVDALNVSDPDVLARVAGEHGFTPDEVRALLDDAGEAAITEREARLASSEGVTGVPFFVFGERFAISGAQPEEAFRLAIEKALEPEPAASGPTAS